MTIRNYLRVTFFLASTLFVASCATTARQEICPPGTQDLPDCPPVGAVDDPEINEIYRKRSWRPISDVEEELEGEGFS